MEKGNALVCVSDFKHYFFARTRLGEDVYSYFTGGAEFEVTLNDNEKAFSKLKLRPRVLAQDVSERSISTYLLGSKVESPIGVAPTAVHRLVWPDGELSSARGAKQQKVCYILSNSSTTTIEDVAEATEGSLKWYQIYMMKNRNLTEDMAKRAAASGYKALVLTVDTPYPGIRWASMRRPLKLQDGFHPVNFDHKSANASYNDVERFGSMLDCGASWTDIEWLKRVSGLPVIVKGITCAGDAKLAVKYGAAAVYVSNHGGRQLDSVPATIDILPEVVQAVAGKVEVYLDGGVRTGTDVIKALALGAQAVFIGKPIIWGLAYNGAEGVSSVLNILKEELSKAMGLCGCKCLSDIGPQFVRPLNGFTAKM